MKDWMKKYEVDKDKTEEYILNARLNKLLDLVDNVRVYNVEDMIGCLSNIVEIYEGLKKSGCDYDEKDMIFRKEQLAKIRYKKLKREHMETHESESWNEFEENEKQDDEEER